MTRQSKKMRQKRTGDRKEESYDSPEIPDRRGSSDIPDLPLGISKALSDNVHNCYSISTVLSSDTAAAAFIQYKLWY